MSFRIRIFAVIGQDHRNAWAGDVFSPSRPECPGRREVESIFTKPAVFAPGETA